MKKLLNLSIVMVMLLGLLPARAAIAEVTPLWEQLPNGEQAELSVKGQQLKADNFYLTETTSIARIEIWSNSAGPYDLTFDIYADTIDGEGYHIPGALVHSEVIYNSSGEEDEICPLNGDGYYYCKYRYTLSFDPSLELAAGDYWLSVYGSAGSNFGWSPAYIPSQLTTYASKIEPNPWNGQYSSKAFAFRLLEPQETCDASVVVVNTNDSGAGSLRQAIADVCPGGTITFDASLSGATILLDQDSQLTIDKDVTIDASALANRVTVNADNMGRVLQVTSEVTATLNSLKISHGYVTGDGGGIYNQGDLTVVNTVLLNNLSSQYGGGIYNTGTLTAMNSNLVINGAQYGGGIFNAGGTLTVNNSTLESNTASSNGGGIYNGTKGAVTVTNSSLSLNQADGGGGIYSASGTVIVIGSTLSVNSSLDSQGFGGGLLNTPGSNMTVGNSTLSGNSAAQGGGGIYNGGTLTLTNSTLSGNSASSSGMGHGLNNSSEGTMNYANTIIANSPESYGDCQNYGTMGTNTNNLVGGGTCDASLSGDPLLAPLADNGGPTQTMALQEGSPAIDAGDNDICSGELVGGVDQRGVSRPQPQGGTCDIGAYEYEGEIPSPNQPPVAYNYYAAFYQWLPTEPPGYTFFVPVMDPEGDDLTISYVSDTDPGTEGVVNGVEVSCYEDGCLAQFEFVGPTDVPREPGSMYITFQYRVNDGTSDSNIATVTLSFGEWPPYAEYDGKQLAAKDGNTRVRLIGEGYTSLNPEDYAFFIAKQPEHGSLGDPTVVACGIKSDEFYGEVYEWLVCIGEVLYTPDVGFGGDFGAEDSFDFVIFDGDSYSEQVTTRLWVADNGPPIAMDATVTVSANQPSQIILEATDPDWKMDLGDFYDMHDIMTFVIGTQPQHGSLGKPSEPICVAENEGANVYARCSSTVLYTPLGDVATEDSFTFYVNDSHSDSNTANLTLNLVEPSTHIVNTIGDAGNGTCDEAQCTLRDAVLSAESGDTITFAESLSNQTITLTQGHIHIGKSLTIEGPGAHLLAISGGENEPDYNDYYASIGGVFKVYGFYGDGGVEEIEVNISGLTIRDGRAREGGGVYNHSRSTLVMTDCVIGPNNVVTESGGGLSNRYGNVTLNRCTVEGNHGTGSIGGAGISGADGVTTLINTTVSGNVTNNHGGGIFVGYNSTLNLIHTTITKNIANQDYEDYPWGGAGGIYVEGGVVNIHNSIVAGNTDMTDPATGGHEKWHDVYGNFTSLGGNLIGDPTGSTNTWAASDQVGTEAEPINPLLAELMLNSPGTTPTHALLTGSPAINAVECAYGVTVDQRGVGRPLPEGGACDIGAYEYEHTVTYGGLKITKIFNPLTSGFTGTFAINYNCDDGVHSGTVNLLASGSDTIYDIPTGTTCTVTEPEMPVAPTGWTFGEPGFNPVDGVVIVSDISPAYAEVVVTNTISRDLGDLVISKDFDPSTSGFGGTFTINYNCNDGHNGTVYLGAGGAETIFDIPTGTTCTVTEPNLPTAPTGWTFGDPSYYPESGIVTITANTISSIGISAVPVGAEVTVYNTISRDTGDLKISKVFDPLTSTFSGDFTIHYDCGIGYTGTVDLAAGESETIYDIPTGTICEVTEPTLPPAPAGWTFGEPSFDPENGRVEITGSGSTIVGISMVPLGAEVTVYNTISEDIPELGDLKISKVFDPLTSNFTDTFTIFYDCGGEYWAYISLGAGGQTTIFDIPLGSQCTISETTLPTPPTGWSFGTPTYSPADGKVTIGETVVEVTVTNTISRDLGELKINKTFDLLTSGFTGTFAINYDCDDGTTHDGTVNLTAGTSQTITGIPTGTQCTVTEPSLPTPPTGWSFGIPTYNPADGTVTISKTIAEVTVTNTISQDSEDNLSQLTSARTKCDVYAAGAADDLPRLFYTFTTNKKTLEDVLKSVTPATFLYYVKATLPPEASTLVIAQENDKSFPAMGASVTLYDENCARLSPQLASVAIVDGNITIDFVAGEAERVVYVAVKYSAKPIIGQIVTGWPDIMYFFSAAFDGSEPFTSADLEVIYIQ